MRKAADIFFEHFGLSPGRSSADLWAIAQAFGTIPWENLSKFLLKRAGEEAPRSAERVMEDHVALGTGGTCYSLTETLCVVLGECGFSARPLTGHMNHGRNTHCALLVETGQGRFLMDPGYAVPGAVLLDEHGRGEMNTPGVSRYWQPVPGGWQLFTEENGERKHRYTLESRVLSRRAFMEYWKRSFSATGLGSLHLNRTDPSGGRLSIHNGNMRVVTDTGRYNIRIGSDFAGRVSELFGISEKVAGAAWKEMEEMRGGKSGVAL
jgi:arylamine N-acetyltransferase